MYSAPRCTDKLLANCLKVVDTLRAIRQRAIQNFYDQHYEMGAPANRVTTVGAARFMLPKRSRKLFGESSAEPSAKAEQRP